MIETQHAPFYLQSVPVSDAYVGKPRLEVLRGYCENKKVLHIGCVDYPVTQLAGNLHLQLAPFCATLDGYDIHTEVYPTLEPYIKNGRFLYSLEEAADYDVVIIPEVLEHIGDVPNFLGEIAKISAKKFLITVPDLFQCFNRHFEYSGKNQVFLEAIHPDHNCWYSPYTIANIIKKYTPWRVADIHFFNQISLLVVADSPVLRPSPINQPTRQREQLKSSRKILLAVDFFWPSVGGLEKQTQEIARHLSAKGYQVTIATGELPSRQARHYQNNPIISLSRAQEPGQPYPKATEQLRQLIASGDYDACILLADPLNWVIGSLESGDFPPQTRIIVQPIINDQGYASWRHNAAFRQRLCSSLKKANQVIAFNPQGPDAEFLLEEQLPVAYIPNACSPIESAEDFRAEMGIDPGRFLLLHVANFFTVKNHLGLIDALAAMPEDWLLVMIGHPVDTDYFQAVSKRIAGAKNIQLIAGLPPAKVQAAMKAADVVLLSSLGEGFPTTLLEAMASAKPWLATPTCGAANQLTGGLIALLEQFPNLLACLAERPQLRQRLGETGYSHWQQCFNWETVITRWEALIEQGQITQDSSPSVETLKQQQDILEEIDKLLKKTNDENPLVSVIITTFNRPTLLLDAVNSVLAQSYRPIEIIVVNDCGQPVEAALATVETQIPLTWVRHGVNRGLSAARNSGMALARGEMICFLDDDDRFLPDHLQTAVAALREPGVDLVYTDAVYVREQLENGQRHELARGEPFKGIAYSREHLLVENFVPVNTWVLRRTLALRSGPFEESYTALEDWEFLLRLTALTEPKPLGQTTVEVRMRTDLHEHMSGRERQRFLPLYQHIYQRHPASSAHVQASRERMLAALAKESTQVTPAATTVTLSVIICSVDDARFGRIARQYHELLTDIPHEIIRIDDASSLCEGYNRGIARSCGDYLIFSHDDLQIWTADFGQRLLGHLQHCDVIGVAGTNRLTDTGEQIALWKYTSWGAAGLGHVFGRIVQRQDDAYAVVVYGAPTPLVEGIQALDGAFIAVRRSVVEAVSFDAETFDGFHLYDLDFSYRAFRQGFRLGVFTDIAILHESAGDYDAVYFNYHRRFLQKFAGELPKYRPRPWQHAFMVFDCPEDVLDFYAIEGEQQPLIAPKTAKANAAADETGSLSDNGLYRRWCERQQVGEGWAEIVGERMVKHWQTQPTFHLVIWCESSQITALADTLESLGQQLYGRWGVSVLAPFACPDGAFNELANVEWIKVAADADAALRQALDASALDWFTLLEPGDRLAAHALLKLADYSNRYPDWRLIYLDEDQLDLRGERRDPIFRPEFDPELLLGTHYLGDCCLIRRDSLPVDSALPYLPGVTTFQAALVIWQRYGAQAIGHLADVLYHRAASRLPVADPEAIANARRRLVTDFLSSRQIAATVEATLLPGAWRVAYQPTHQPKVSIIILAKDALDRLDRCLRKLLAKTAYPDYEVVVVDCGSEAEDTFDLYADLAERYPDRFRWIVATGPLSATAYRNQGAQEAQGEVLLFLTASALVVQAGWIERLLHHALRQEIGIVGGRLTTPDAVRPFVYGTAQLLGLRGLTGPLFAGLGLKAPGPLGRAQVDQTVSAVSADCLMIRREVFEALGGFDPAYAFNHADTDLCLRAAARGYRTLWTPFANLAWLGEYPLATGGDRHSDIAAQVRSDAERLFAHWLPQLANDPAYNRNLSLVEPHRVEVDLAPGWDTAFHDRPRILGFPADETGCALYRIYAPLWLLEHQAQAECTLIKSGARPPELTELERLAPDTVFYQGMIADLGIAAMRQYRRFHRSFKVFDLDDLKHNVPDANSLKERLVRDVKHRHRQALAQCDRLIVSTEPLAEACRPWIGDIRVVPNRLERARWGHLQNRRRVGPKPRVGWAGAQQHHGDLAFISEVVKQTAAEVDWIFFGMCLEDVRPYVKEVHGWVHLNDYPAKLASLDLDLAVAPLELHPFNQAKSNLRILEHGILGRPMICTDIEPYRNAPVQQVANDTAAWVAAIRERIHDLDAAEREGDALRAWVLEHYILDDHTSDWLRALQP